MGLDKPYYSQQIRGWSLIFLDGTEDVSLYRCMPEYQRTKEAAVMQESSFSSWRGMTLSPPT